MLAAGHIRHWRQPVKHSPTSDSSRTVVLAALKIPMLIVHPLHTVCSRVTRHWAFAQQHAL